MTATSIPSEPSTEGTAGPIGGLTAGDLAVCDREPIRIPGSIQPHGALLALDADQRIVQASANALDWLGLRLDPLAGPRLAQAVPEGWADLPEALAAWSKANEGGFLHAGGSDAARATAVAHRSGGLVLLEFEAGALDLLAAGRLQGRLQGYVEQIAAATQVRPLCQRVTEQVRALTGFDRVLIYRFGPDWSGTTLAESNDGGLQPLLDLRFPASDIPAQARELYRLNRLRIIPDADYTPSPILPARGYAPDGPLDLSLATLRSVSPVHLQYMRNMGTPASMSISILVNGELWGLISCHHTAPRTASLQVRNACDFLGQVLAVQLGALLRGEHASRRVELAGVQAQLLGHIAKADTFADGLAERPDVWMALTGASGAAVVADGEVQTAGATPDAGELRGLATRLQAMGDQEVFASDALARDLPGAPAPPETASGLLAVRISELHPSYLMWFRREVVHEVSWSGDPRKQGQAGVLGDAGRGAADARISPRKSFELWKETVRGQAAPWSAAEVETASAFRAAVIALVLRRAEERAQLSAELQRSNQELEAFSYSVSHDLRAPFRHIVGYAELLQEREAALDQTSRHYIQSIRDAAVSAGRLVDDLLQFSRIGRSAMSTGRIDMNKLVVEARKSLALDLAGRDIAWRIDPLPPAFGDASLLRQTLINLLSNAVKYTRDRKPGDIHISAQEAPDETVYTVADNGVGFDMAYAGKLFGVFQRLHRAEDFEGTGIGLAIAERVVHRHGGRIWGEGELGHGATFRFALPRLKGGVRRG